jgi:hypothetical protein
MKKTSIYFTDKQHQALKQVSLADGIKIAELVRRAIDEYLAKLKRRPK